MEGLSQFLPFFHAIRLLTVYQPLLPKSKYYTAVGSVVDAALSRVLDDILKLPDITAEESHRLSELCRILHALEALFVEDSDQASCAVFIEFLMLNSSLNSPLSSSRTFPAGSNSLTYQSCS